MELAHPRFRQSQHQADFLHRQLLVVVKRQNDLLFFRQHFNGLLQSVFQLVLCEQDKGVALVDPLENVVTPVLFAIVRRQVLALEEGNPAGLVQELVVLFEGDAEVIGDFLLLRLPPQELPEFEDGLLDFRVLVPRRSGLQSRARSSSSTAPRILKRA